METLALPHPEGEADALDIHISILSPPEALPCRDDDDLVGKLRPGIDGLIVSDGPYRATYLPAVWEELSDPREFVRELRMKAGLAQDHWSDTIRFERYTAESVSKPH